MKAFLRSGFTVALAFALWISLLTLLGAGRTPAPLLAADVGPDLSVVKYTNWPYEPQAAPGDLIAFSLRVENLGPGNGQAVVLTDTLPPFLTYEDSQNNLCDGPCPVSVNGRQVVWQLGNLPAETRYQYITLWARVSSSVTVGAVLTNSAEIRGVGPEIDGEPNDEISDPYANNQSLLEISIIPFLPDLQVSNDLRTGVVAPGERFRYGIFLVNQGGAGAEDVILTDTLPLSVTFLAHSSQFPALAPQLYTPTVSGRTVVWHLGDLPRDAWGSFFIDVEADSSMPVGGILYNESRVSTRSPELDRYANLFVSEYGLVANTPNLWIDKYTDGPRTPGSRFAYIIRLANNGGGRATGVRITDTLPPELGFVSATSYFCPDPLAPEVCQSNVFTQTVDGQQVAWEIGVVPPGIGDAQIRAIVDLSDTLVPGAPITNVVRVQGWESDENPDDNLFVSVLPVIEVSEPDVALFKSTTSSPPRPGGSVSYRLRVVNQGAFRLENVILTDTLPAGVVLRESSSDTCFAPPDCVTNGFAPGLTGGKAVWQLGEIGVNGYGDFFLTVDLPLTMTEGFVLTNTAAISADNPESDRSDNISQAVVTVVGIPQLAIHKSGPAMALWRHPITYTLTVTNSGDGRADGLVITDALPAGSVYWNGGTPAGGVVSWTLPTLAAGADVQVSFVVSAEESLHNREYGAMAAGGVNVRGSQIVTTTVVRLSAANSGPAQVGSAVHFTASLSAATPMSYRWNFGDGALSAPSVMLTATHVYTKDGVYSATVTATSDLGVLVTTTPVVIQPHRVYMPLLAGGSQ